MPDKMQPMPLILRIGLWLWLIAALVVGRLLWLTALPRPALQGIIFGLTGLILLLYFKARPLRQWIDDLDLRALVFFHVTRFVGLYFLLLYQRGELPYAFAVPGGWGDIVVATGALLVCLLPMADTTRHRAIRFWNILGLTDIVLVLVTAARLGFQNPAELRALTYLPLSLLPTFLVPLIIATHVIIFVQLRREEIKS
jgi:hypothetical protein